MPRQPNPVPTYRRHKQSGQAVVTVRRPDGSRRDILLGKYNSPESKAEYERILAELRASPAAAVGLVTGGRDVPDDLSVNELLVRFLTWAAAYYAGSGGSELAGYRLTARTLKGLYGHTPARGFGPLALKACQADWVAAGLSRKECNRRLRMAKRVFRWGVAEELLPPAVHHGLAAVEGLRQSRTPARESEPVRPADPAAVDALAAVLPPPLAGLVRFQVLTGCRPGEACRVRPCDLDTSRPVWAYTVPKHKNAHRGKARVVAVGPKAQAVLNAHWPADPEGYFFSPAAAVAVRRAERAAGRVTPRYPSHERRNETNRVGSPKRVPGACYTSGSYAKAVRRAFARMQGGRVAVWRPNMLRHLYGTLARRRFGLDGAQVALGHAKADVTQVYAEADHELAERVAAELG